MGIKPLRFLALAALITGAILNVSCSSVNMPAPLAETTAQPLREALAGAWRVDDGVIFVAFDEKGHGQIAFVEREDDEFVMRQGDLAAVERNDRHFLSMRVEEDGELEDEYYFAEYKGSQDPASALILWAPDVDVFAQAVKDKLLPGEVDGGKHTSTVTLQATPDEVLGFILKHKDSMNLREPAVFTRLSGSDAF